MHPSRLSWILPVLLVALSCKKEEAPAPPPPPPPAQAPAPAAAPAPEKKAEEKALPPAVGPTKGTASITGEVKLDGPAPEMQPLKRGVDPVCAKTQMNDEQVLARDGKLQNVVVWISEGLPAQPAPAEQARLEQTSCMYRPRVQAVQEGQTIAIHNGDATLHNVRAVSGTKTLFNKAQPPGTPAIAEPVQPGTKVLQFKCDVHPWMKGFAVVVPNGFSAVTGPDGRFTLKDLPAGTYTVSAWHELFGTKSTQVTVTDGKSTPILMSYNPQDRG